MTARTYWTAHLSAGGGDVIAVTVESVDPAVVDLIEQAAAAHGVALVRDLSLRARIRAAIAGDVDPARLPGLEATVDRVVAVLKAEIVGLNVE